MSELPPWKQELDSIVGARHGGQASAIISRLTDLDKRYPNVPDIAFQVAWTLDVLGRPAEARVQYERAIALGLGPNDLAGALIGLAMTLRELGEADRAVAVLESAQRQFPTYREFDLYLGLCLHSAGKHGEAVRRLIETALEITDDPGLNAHQRALRYQASRL